MVVVELTAGDHTVKWTLSGYNILNAVINVSSTGVVTCKSVTDGLCGGTALPRVSVSGSTVTGYLLSVATPTLTPIPTPVPADICSWITAQGGWNNLNWTNHVLKAYYVYIGAPGYTIGYSPVTWDSVLGLYYYYIGLKSMGNSKTGCGFT